MGDLSLTTFFEQKIGSYIKIQLDCHKKPSDDYNHFRKVSFSFLITCVDPKTQTVYMDIHYVEMKGMSAVSTTYIENGHPCKYRGHRSVRKLLLEYILSEKVNETLNSEIDFKSISTIQH